MYLNYKNSSLILKIPDSSELKIPGHLFPNIPAQLAKFQIPANWKFQNSKSLFVKFQNSSAFLAWFQFPEKSLTPLIT